MTRIRLIHWSDEEAQRCADRLRAAGYEVDSDLPDGPKLFRALRAAPPDAVVIDLSRLPSHGRDVAIGLRSFKATRRVPLVFVDGEERKVAAIRKLLPDAEYASWRGIRPALKRALARGSADPVVPGSSLAGYSGTPLAKKLGIKAGARVGLLDAPDRFESTLGALPEGVGFARNPRSACDLVIWFVRSRKDLAARLDRAAGLAGRDGLWIVWPKKAGTVATDVGQAEIRESGLAAGLVDYKICAVDATWSGLKFAKRKQLSR